jgi:flagellar protein FlaJ
LNYPKATIKSKAKKIDNELPFATLYLSTIIGSRLPLHRAFEIFARFGGYTEIVKEVKLINSDIRSFGLDIHTALERAVERSPSKNFSELLWGILSTSRSGGNIVIYLKEKSKDFMEEYRRKLHQFTRSLALFVEIYLTAIILGSVFFTILTAIISGIGGATGNIFILQFFLIFIFIPLVSVLFIFLVKTAMPGGEM